ncbi:hypothetical protein AnigIFM49718_006658 [Aspergillus niger]|nr:hypothetical protein AnigIFM49718_006658 [Aspergillus niger]
MLYAKVVKYDGLADSGAPRAARVGCRRNRDVPLPATRSKDLYGPALNIPGEVDQTKINTLVDVANLHDETYIVKGSIEQFWASLMVRELSAETIIKAVRWSEEIREPDKSVADCTYLIIELQSSPAGPLSNCAWPRPAGVKHILLLGPGCPSNAGPVKLKLVRDLDCQAASRVLGQDAEVNYLPNGFEGFHDARKTWGHHFQKLQTARQYDPKNKLKGAISVGDA